MSAETQLPVNREPPPETFMTQWVIYDHPSDHPDGYVLRAAFIGKDHTVTVDSVAWFAKKIEVLRMIVPPGLHCMPRFENDDPAILEVWI
jgi:hypothetical protein